MKRQYKFLSGILVIFSLVSIVSAQNLGDLMGNLGSEVTFGYSNTTNISVTAIGTGGITIQSPLIKDELGKPVASYTVMYSQYPLTEILDKTDLLNQTKEQTITSSGTNDPFTMDINMDSIDSSKKYYFFVIPNNSTQNMGQISNEIWVDFASKSYGDVGDPVGTTLTTHSAADVDMSLAHISHTINGKVISLTWSAIAGSNTVEIDVMGPGESLYTKLATVNMNSERYAYTANKNGEYVFRFIAVDCATQVTYTVSFGGETAVTPPPPTPGVITKVPKTGPGETFIAVLLMTGLLYFGYSKLYRKTK